MTENRQRAEQIGRVRLFEGIAPERLAVLAGACREVCVGKGDGVIQEDEPGGSMFVLIEGRVRITKSLTLKVGSGFADREKAFNFLDAPCTFGEVSLIDGSPRSASVTAEAPCRLLELPGSAFYDFCDDDPATGYVLMRRICENLSGLLARSNADVIKLATALSLALHR
ncbi:MAG: cyclic nucleotide-binding domain-containing protein [Armatimonadetes bacterium]|nr:cyclic nucleotide-binding domain-containing protein [Armatimonadota bacterium]